MIREYFTDYDDKEFERIVVALCHELFGMGTLAFSDGKDGGRDALFTGTAQLYPSTASQWKGKTVIQAKHTSGYNKSFNEGDFFSEESNTAYLNKEVKRIKSLVDEGKLDNYLLVANRKLPGNVSDKITEYVHSNTGLPVENFGLIGIELFSMYHNRWPELLKRAGVFEFDRSLTIYTEEMSEVIQSIAAGIDDLDQDLKHSPKPRIPYKAKNELNKLSHDFSLFIRKKYLVYTTDIDSFLSHPDNKEVRDDYFEIVEDFQRKILEHHDPEVSFDKTYNRLIDLMLHRDTVLRSRKYRQLTKAMIFYMYWICDIGRSE